MSYAAMQEAEKPLLDAFASWLRERGYSPRTIDVYVRALAGGLADPIAHVRRQCGYEAYVFAKCAVRLYAQQPGKERPDIIQALLAIPAPPKSAKRPLIVPNEATWCSVGEQAARRHPDPMACVLWLIYFSGLRIGGVLRISREQAQQVVSEGVTVIVEKGRGGVQERRWRPSGRCRRALAVLLRLGPWSVVWASVAVSKETAERKVREAIPGGYNPHSFRHRFARSLEKAGVHLKTIMGMGGWSNIATLSRYLGPVDDEDMDDANARLEARILAARAKA